MDVFAALIPGAMLLSGIGVSLLTETGSSLGLVPKALISGPLGVTELVLFTTFSFVAGMIIQSVGRVVEHKLDELGRCLKIQPGSFPDIIPFRRMSMKHEIEALNDERSSLEDEFWKICQNEFDFPDEGIYGDNAKQLWRFIHANLAASPYSLTIRFRALNNMCRGLWTVFGFLSIYYTSVVIIPYLFNFPSGGRTLLTIYAATSFIFMISFAHIRRMFKRLYFNYLVLEYKSVKSEQRA